MSEPLDGQEERRRRRERWLIGIFSILIAGFTYLEIRLSRFSEGLPVTNNLLFFGLVNVNVILTLALVFLVFRNVAKLVFDRRTAGGTPLRNKLVLAFAGFTLVPSVLLFSVATGFVVNSVNSWFDPIVESSLSDALEVARLYYQRAEDDVKEAAVRIATAVGESGQIERPTPGGLPYIAEERRGEWRIDAVEIFGSSEASLARSADATTTAELKAIEPAFLAIGLDGTVQTRTQTFGRADLVSGIAPIWPRDCPEYSRHNDQSIRGCRPSGAVLVQKILPESVKAKTGNIYTGFAGYRQVKIYKSPLETSYVAMLSTITLLVIFAATWLGILLARGISGPLKTLADATREVAAGNLDVAVPETGGDEIGQVVHAFNRMTGELKSSRERVEKANADLLRSNVELEQRRRYMEVVLKNIAAGVVAFDREGRISAMNDAAARLLAVPDLSRVLGRRYADVLPESYRDIAGQLLAELEAAPSGSASKQVTISIQGETRTVLVTINALRERDSGEARPRTLGMVVVLDDLTPILRAQRAAAWREVARRIAHEIKNPLTPVQLSAQRLKRRFADQIAEGREVFDECTDTIGRQVEELRQLVNEFSEFARMPEARPLPSDLNATVAEAVALFRNAHAGISIRLDADPAMPVFDLDREQIKRAVINLVDNACAAVDGGQGSAIDVSTDYEPGLGIARVTVSDDGPGIAPDAKSRLFEPYFSTKKTGTGLGLSIVHRIVADHEGFIRVQENRPRGTRFVIELPVKGADESRRRAADAGGKNGP